MFSYTHWKEIHKVKKQKVLKALRQKEHNSLLWK